MKYNQFVKAFPAIKKLSEMSFRAKDAFNIYTLMKEVDPILQFGIEREKQLVKQYNGVPLGDGKIQFVHGEDEEAVKTGMENMQKFADAADELSEMEITDTIHPVTLSYDAMGDQAITPKDIMALDGFVIFE